MIKVLNLLGVAAMAFSIYRGVELYNMPTENTVVVEHKMEVKENTKINPPKEDPKSFDPKLISRLEMIDSSDIVVEEHINQILDQSKYNCMGKDRDDYVCAFSSSVLNHTKGDLKLALWVTAMAQVESSYRLSADPKISTAKGFLQVIYRYHKKELSKAGITEEDLRSNPEKSIRAGIIVFNKYLKIERNNYRKATRRYRGLSVSEEEQTRYYNAIKRVYNKLLDDLHEYA